MNYAPSTQFGPATSAWLILVANTAAFGWMAFAVVLAWRDGRRARLLVGAPADPEKLRSNFARLVGVVELARGDEGAAIEVTVYQRKLGSISVNRGGQAPLWRETRREASARPFYLRLDGGRRIRVDPSDCAIDLAARFGRPVPFGIDGQSRTVTLEAGDRVFVVGELDMGVDPETTAFAPGISYREPATTALVLLPQRGVLRITPSDPQLAPSRHRLLHLGGIAVAALWLATVQLDSRAFRALRERGAVVTGTVARTEYYTTGGKSRRWICNVVADVEGRRLTSQIDCARVADLRKGAAIPWTVVPPWSHVGAHEEGLGSEWFSGMTCFAVLYATYLGHILTDERRRRIRAFARG